MAKKRFWDSNGFWIAVALIIVGWMYHDEIMKWLASMGSGVNLSVVVPSGQLPQSPTTCSERDLGLEFTRYFGAVNMQTMADGCRSNGGVWVSQNNQVSCHWTHNVTFSCNQPALNYVAALCSQLKATYTCSNDTKFVGCLCNLAPPNAPLDGFPEDNPDNQDSEDTCRYQYDIATGGGCVGTCPEGECCELLNPTFCGCVEEGTYVKGQVGSVFITSVSWNGAMGGAIGADEKCSVTAQYAGLSGNWRAIISDDLQAVRSKLPDSTAIPYYLLDGTKLADSASDLFDGTINNAINVDEHMNKVAGKGVWTGSSADGQSTGSNCHNWGWVSSTGTSGSSDSNFAPWINSMADDCSVSKRLYCARVS